MTPNQTHLKTSKLCFDEPISEPLPIRLKNSMSSMGLSLVHQHIQQSDDGNVGVISAHQVEHTVEDTLKNTHKLHLKRKRYQNYPTTSRKSHALKRHQAKHIKKDYALLHPNQSTKTIQKSGKETKRFSAKVMALLVKNKEASLVILGILLIITFMLSTLTSCSYMALGSFSTFMGTSYGASDDTITAVDLEFTRLETDLEHYIKHMETHYPGYDDYRYDLQPIGHDPHELIAYLSAAYEDFTYEAVLDALHQLFMALYQLDIASHTETRYRLETHYIAHTFYDPVTDSTVVVYDTHHEWVPYDYHYLTTSLTKRSFKRLALERLEPEQKDLYHIYMYTKGNKQYFGNPLPFNWQSYVSSPFGWRIHPISHQIQLHSGLDLAVPLGTPIQAIHTGTVTQVGYDPDHYGHFVVIDDEKGYRSIYAHCEAVYVSQGSIVSKGQLIATVGSSGSSTGSHLHLELHHHGQSLNPYFFIQGTDPYHHILN